MTAQLKMKVNAQNPGSISVALMINQITLSISLPFIGSSKLLPLLDMAIMLVQPQMSTSSPSLWNSWDLHSSLS